MEQEYWDGKYGKPYTGGDYNKWLEGAQHGGHKGGSSASCLGALLIIPLLILFIPTAMATLASIIMALIWLVILKNQTFGKLFVASFWISFSYFLVFLISFYSYTYLSFGQDEIHYNLEDIIAVTSEKLFWLQIPSLVVASLIMRNRLAKLGEKLTFKQVLVFSLLVILPICGSISWLTHFSFALSNLTTLSN